MERLIFKPVGTPVEELETPFLVVDMDALTPEPEQVEAKAFVDVAMRALDGPSLVILFILMNQRSTR